MVGWSRRAAVAAALVCASIALPAQATVLMEMSIEALTASADLVVTVEVGEQWSQLDEGDQRVRTYTRVQVSDVVHRVGGDERLGAQLVVQQEGGHLGDWGVHVAGNAQLATGQTALLFLTRDEAGGFYHVLGMEQGMYRVDTDETGAQIVHRAATVPVVVQNISGTNLFVEHPIARWDGHALETLLSEVRSAAGAARETEVPR